MQKLRLRKIKQFNQTTYVKIDLKNLVQYNKRILCYLLKLLIKMIWWKIVLPRSDPRRKFYELSLRTFCLIPF